MMKLKEKNFLGYAGIFVLLLFLCWLFPYSGDDWAWGCKMGIERLNTWFDDYNGRYFGNLIVIALTRSNLLKTVVMALCLTGIMAMLNELSGRQSCGLGIISLLMVFMPVSQLMQGIVWTAGFSNYVTSIFFTLIYIFYVRKIYEQKPDPSYLACVPLLILGLINTLIVEHLTIYNVILSLYVIAFTVLKYKKVCIQHIAYCAGCIAGTILMFSNSAYSKVAQGADDYRTIGSEEGILSQAYHNFSLGIIKFGFLNNILLLLCLLAVCLVLWFEIKDSLSKRRKIIGTISVMINIAYVATSFTEILNTHPKPWLLVLAESLATVAYCLALLAFVLILPVAPMKKVRLLFILISAGLIIAPLLVVSPIGPRCFFASYVMFLYFILELYSGCNDTHKKQAAALGRTLATAVAVGTLYLFYIYGTITINNEQRIAKAKKDAANGAKTLEIQALPYKNYVWCSDLADDVWSVRFKLYYGIDEDVKIKMIPNK